jgi:hypothetical protein
MPKKDVNNTFKSSEKKKAETSVVKGTITLEQRKILQKFIGVIGSNEQDVVGKIITLWLYNEGHLDINKKTNNTK